MEIAGVIDFDVFGDFEMESADATFQAESDDGIFILHRKNSIMELRRK